MHSTPVITANTPAAIEQYASELLSGPNWTKAFAVADLPDATEYYHADRVFHIGVIDSSSGVTLCVSNGTNWIDLQTGSAVV